MTKKEILTILSWAFFSTALITGLTGSAGTDTDPEETETADSRPVPVEVIHPAKDHISRIIPYLGTVKGDDDGHLSFRIQGTLAEIHVQEGQKVRRGEVLATLSVPEMDAQLRRAESEFERSEAAKVFWESELQTDRTLFNEGAIARTVLDKTAFNFEQALGSYNAAAAAVTEVQKRLELATLTAPAPGIIGSILVQEGVNVGPNQPVFFFNSGRPVIFAEVLEQDIRQGISVGTIVTAEDSAGNPVAGRVERMDFQAKPPFRTVRVFVTLPEPVLSDRPSGAGIPLDFHVNRQEHALMVPLSAIDLRDRDPRVLRVTDRSIAEAVPVELGLESGELRQISGRISESDRIISSGITNVVPGDRVRIIQNRP